MNKIISFPHLGNYYHPFSKLLTLLTEKEVRIAPPITKKTLELAKQKEGSKKVLDKIKNDGGANI